MDEEFLKTVGGVSLAGLFGDLAGASESASLDIGSLFEANSPEVLALAERVMEKCVLEKIMRGSLTPFPMSPTSTAATDTTLPVVQCSAFLLSSSAILFST